MKVKIDDNKGFKPFDLTLTFETTEEAHAFYALTLTCDSVPKTAKHYWGKLIASEYKLTNMLQQLGNTLEAKGVVDRNNVQDSSWVKKSGEITV